jgi:hypothetical protein
VRSSAESSSERGDWRALEHAVDGVRARFGDHAVGPAALLGAEGLRLGPRGSPWGPGAEPRTSPDRDRPDRDGPDRDRPDRDGPGRA